MREEDDIIINKPKEHKSYIIVDSLTIKLKNNIIYVVECQWVYKSFKCSDLAIWYTTSE